MKTLEKRQTAKVGVAGSFFNQLMANNATIPQVGKGATELLYTDRRCYEVIEVSEDGKTARLQFLEAEWDKKLGGGQGHQNWILKPIERYLTVTWRQGAWRMVGKEISFTKEFLKECESNGINFIGQWMRKNNPELADKIWAGDIRPQNVVEGYTKERIVYEKIKLIFGVKEYYYDWEF